MHQCHKELHKQAKLTKNFIAQKLIRKLKEETASSSETTSRSTSSSSALLQQQKLQQVKDYELEWVIQECFRRLGIRQLDPKLQHRPPTAAGSLRNKKDADVADGETFADKTTESIWGHDDDDDEEEEKHETPSVREDLPPAPNGDDDDNASSTYRTSLLLDPGAHLAAQTHGDGTRTLERAGDRVSAMVSAPARPRRRREDDDRHHQ